MMSMRRLTEDFAVWQDLFASRTSIKARYLKKRTAMACSILHALIPFEGGLKVEGSYFFT